MKKLFTLLFLFAFSIAANAGGKYGYCKLIFVDGTSRIGLVETSFDKEVRFKSSDDAEPEKIPSEKLRTLSFLKEDGRTPSIEFDYIKVYLGWGQTRISKDYGWFEVLQRGFATLYLKRTEMRGSIYNNTSAGFLDYYVIRDGEPAAKVIANVSSFNNNQTFHAKAPLYFADYPELAEKIKSKEYTWKELGTVVRKYNEWAAANKK